MRYYTAAETMPATVYVLRAADQTFFKIGRSMQLGERVQALCRQFDFNLEQSLCFHFENKQYALLAERELLASVKGWEVIFDEPFPGYTEYFIEPGYYMLVRTLALTPLEGLIAIESIVDALCLEDYDPPIVKTEVPAWDSGPESDCAHQLTPSWRAMGWGLSPRRTLIRGLQRRWGGKPG